MLNIRIVFPLFLIAFALPLVAQPGTQSHLPRPGTLSVAQLDPTSPTGAILTEIPTTGCAGPVHICGSAANAVFAFCNMTEHTIVLTVHTLPPNPTFPVEVPAQICISFNPTWVTPASLAIGSHTVAIFEDC